METKTCTKCGEEKALDCFSKNQSWCKACSFEYTRKYYKANPEKCNERQRKYRKANPEKFNERQRKHRKANPEKCRERNRKHSKRRWVEREMKSRGITEPEAVTQYEVMQVFRKNAGTIVDTNKELFMMGFM